VKTGPVESEIALLKFKKN